LADNTVAQRVAALRCFFTRTLKRSWLIDETPYPKQRTQLPVIPSPDEVARLIESADSPFLRTIFVTLYATGVRRAELTNLDSTGIDSQRMAVHIRIKGERERESDWTAGSCR
jgi:site-specific recombinase XerD